MNLVYLAFGNNITIHSQANFSILTFLSQKQCFNKIIVLTDNPEFYKHLSSEDCIKIEAINDEVLNTWKGEYNFFWRIKIKALEYVFNLNPSQHILYLDADTFLFNGLEFIVKSLDSGKNIMHLNEGKLSMIKSKTTSKMWNQIKDNTYAGISINKEHCMWNAGVVGVSKLTAKETLAQALIICDQMCEEKVTDRLIEQFALSLALNSKTNLVSAERYIGHYWGNKEEWNRFINATLLKFYFGKYNLNQQVVFLTTTNFSSLPVLIKIPNTRKRLVKLVTKLFPNKFEKYIS